MTNKAQRNEDTFDDLFPFEYQGGGYFRRRGVPKGESADIIHGEQAVRFLYDNIQRQKNMNALVGI